MVFAANIKPVTIDTLSQITAQAVDSRGSVFQLVVEYVGPVIAPEDLTALIVRLPAGMAVGDIAISVTFKGARSNSILVSIRGP